jgi:hypothetical protein
MANFDYLQPILGTSKRNPVFSVHRHSVTGDYHVYYGLELFEAVPCDHENPQFKLMLAHLHNIGVTLMKLQEVFGIDPRTILNWSRALKSGSAEKLSQALAGRSGQRKLTRPVEEYVRIRFPYVYADDKRSYSRTIRAELARVFNVELSGETLRPLFAELRAHQEGAPGPENDSELCETQPCDLTEAEETSDEQSDDDDPQPPDSGTPPDGRKPLKKEPEEALKSMGEPLEALEESPLCASTDRNPYAGSQWCSHLGLTLFAEPIESLRQAMASEGGYVGQWLAQVLLGAANLEQTKLLSGHDLSLLLGLGDQGLGTPGHQRLKLAELAHDPELPGRILRWNFERLAGGSTGGMESARRDFYFDPHVKHYTGQQNVLKGWCAKIRWADKVINMDVAHDAQGRPVYVENTDNYEDMRKRFDAFEGRFRLTLGIDAEAELTWVIDRGIYSMEVFDRMAQDPRRHLITWEKGYQAGAWEEGRAAEGSISMQRTRNHAGDQRTYHFQWIEEAWAKNPAWRQIVVRATNPDGRTVEVSILSDERSRPAGEVVWLIFDRWVQENDFKYLDEHFGLNEITSYQSQTYAEIRGELDDRQVKNSAYRALETSRIELREKLGRLLVLDRDAENKGRERAGKIAHLESLSEPNAQRRAELGRLKGAMRTAEKHCMARKSKAGEIEKMIGETEQELENTSREVSRLDTLISREAVRLCGDRKQLMDVIKITARNIFYEVIAPFIEAYDNFRDDHVWFRHIVRSGGVLEELPDRSLRCHLVGIEEAPKPVLRVLRGLLEKFNQSAPRLPGEGRRDFQLLIAKKSAIQLATAIPS